MPSSARRTSMTLLLWKAIRRYQPLAPRYMSRPPLIGRFSASSRRVIFGMSAGHDHPIVREELEALAMKVLIGDDVVVDALMIEPVEEMGVGIVLPQARAMATQP